MPERYAPGEGSPSPSRHFLDHLPALAQAARLGPILDLACGRGRHTLASARAGLPVIGMDRRIDFLEQLRERAAAEALEVSCARTNLEAGYGIPLRQGACGAVLVFRYLHRPLAPAIEAAIAPGGLLLYETFTLAQRDLDYGPSNPIFLLESGELARLFPGLV
ncbi:MAG: class I SAM-dependent methyltransferase, partial [Deltaproteobacteria bacterium]|nr:class I SAM-dependent methyltransferase [Deltaproteobacteria bacterium]